MELTEDQIQKIRDRRVKEREMQIKLVNGERPEGSDNPLTDEKEILKKLHSLSFSSWLFAGKTWPHSVYEKLKIKYAGMFVLKWCTLTFKDVESI